MKIRIAFAALLLLMAVVATWLSVRVGRQNDRIALLEQQLKSAQTRPALQAATPAPQAPAAPPAAAPETPPARRGPAVAASCPETESLNSKLREASATISRVQARIAELEPQVEELTRDRTRLAASENDAQSRLTELNRTIEALNAERPRLDKRIKDVETENARLHAQAQTSSQKGTQFAQLVTDFQELSRRQQVYTNNILRRYRELTDLFRSLPGMVENKGNGPELARMQTAISMADEDLRQVNDLNVRLGRVQKQIADAARP